jgi:hypothetical protein
MAALGAHFENDLTRVCIDNRFDDRSAVAGAIVFISRTAAKASYGRPRDFFGAHTRPFFELHGVSLDRELSVCAIRTCKTTTVDAIAISNNSMPSKIPLVCSVLFKNWELWIGLLTSLND